MLRDINHGFKKKHDNCLVILMIGLFRFRKQTLGGRLNKKDGLTRYGNSHVKDKTS